MHPRPRRIRRLTTAAAFALAVAALGSTGPAHAGMTVPDGIVGPPSAPTAPLAEVADASGEATTSASTSGALVSGQALNTSQTLTSPNGRFRLRLTNGAFTVVKNGTTTVYRSAQPTWARTTSGDRLALQSDGNLVLYTRDNKPAWATWTHGSGHTVLRMQDDGNLVLYSGSTGRALWWSGIRNNVSTLPRGEVAAGQSLFSPDGTKQLIMQGDGNLVLYRGTLPLWNSRTQVKGSRLVNDGGRAVVVAPGGQAVWNSPGGRDAHLVVQDDANLVLYAPGPVWHTNTSVPDCSTITGPVAGSQMVRGANGVLIHPCLAGSFNRMVADAAAQGIDLRGGGWRDQNVQIELRKKNCGGSDEYTIWQKPSGQCTPPTAIPGRSMHERGLAIDFSAGGRSITPASPQFVWLTRNAANYGLYNLPSEPWHWSTNGH